MKVFEDIVERIVMAILFVIFVMPEILYSWILRAKDYLEDKEVI